MKILRSRKVLLAGVFASVISAPARADAVFYTSYADWSSAIGGTDAKIDFNIGVSGPLDEQYAWMGVHFAPGQATAVNSSYALDDWLAATTFPGGHKMIVDYDLLQFALAGDFINIFKVTFYLGDTLVYASGPLSQTGEVFRGIVLDSPFDRAVLERVPGPQIGFIDNLYVGTPIPGPAAGAALLAGLLAGGRRRRWVG